MGLRLGLAVDEISQINVSQNPLGISAIERANVGTKLCNT